MPKLISMADICIDPYSKKDMTPSGKLLEWMACGKCVVVTRNPSYSSWIQDNYNGILFIPDDEQDLVNKLKLLLEERSLIEFLGQNARSSIISDYEVKRVAEVFEELCHRAIARHKAN